MHLYLDDPVTLAGFAATTFHVEAEAPWLVAAGTGFLGAREQFPHRGENTGVGGRVGARGATDGALIDIHHLVEMLKPFNGFMGRRSQSRGLIELGRGQGVECAID